MAVHEQPCANPFCSQKAYVFQEQDRGAHVGCLNLMCDHLTYVFDEEQLGSDFPCLACNSRVYVTELSLSKPMYCISCYQPENPTRGWMIAEYSRRGLDEDELFRFRQALSGKGDSQKLDKWLQSNLGINPKGRAEEEDKNAR